MGVIVRGGGGGGGTNPNSPWLLSGTEIIYDPISAAVVQVRMGRPDSAAPVDQILTVAGARVGTDPNTDGADLTIQPGIGTGTGTRSILTIRTPTIAAAGTGAQTMVTRLIFNDGFAQMGTSRFEYGKGADVAAANDLTLGTDGNLFVITGNTQINAITTLNWQAGSTIYLEFSGTPTVKNNTAGGAGTAKILTVSGSDVTMAANSRMALFFDGTNWLEFGASFAGANTALSNLVTPTLINTTLQSDTDATDALGTLGIRWTNGFFSGTITWTNGAGVASSQIGQSAAALIGIYGATTAVGSDMVFGSTELVAFSSTVDPDTAVDCAVGRAAAGAIGLYANLNHNTDATLKLGSSVGVSWSSTQDPGVSGDTTFGRSAAAVLGCYGSTLGTGSDLTFASGKRIQFSSTTDPDGTADTFLTRPAAATWQMGAANAAAPVSQILTAQGSRPATDNNVAGGNITIQSGAGTGNSVGSLLILRTYKAVASGTGVQTLITRLTFNDGFAQMGESRFEVAKGADVAAANDLTLGLDGNLFIITGNTTINAITTTSWQAGSEITLIFSGTPTVKNNTAGGGGTAVMLLAGSVDFAATANAVLKLVFDGTQWQEVSRKVA